MRRYILLYCIYRHTRDSLTDWLDRLVQLDHPCLCLSIPIEKYKANCDLSASQSWNFKRYISTTALHHNGRCNDCCQLSKMQSSVLSLSTTIGNLGRTKDCKIALQDALNRLKTHKDDALSWHYPAQPLWLHNCEGTEMWREWIGMWDHLSLCVRAYNDSFILPRHNLQALYQRREPRRPPISEFAESNQLCRYTAMPLFLAFSSSPRQMGCSPKY